MTQTEIVKNMLLGFNMKDGKSANTSMQTGFKTSVDGEIVNVPQS